MRFLIVSALAATLAGGGIAAAQVTSLNRTTTRTAYMVEPFTPATPITINGTGVRLRAEPFTGNDTQVLSTGSTGLQLTVVGLARQSDWNWYQVILRNGQKAFIRSDLTSAPMRGDATATYTPPVQLAQQPPTLQTWTPPAAPQPLSPTPTQPVQGGSAISLTPGSDSPSQLDLPRASTPAPSVDGGLISVAPTAPVPHLSNSASVAPASSADIGQQIRAQLDDKRCWTDSGNMMDAQRLRATFGVSFSANGKFASEPRLIAPASEPSDDPAMMVFLAKARAAMRTCNNLGFDLPAGGAQGEIRLDFSAR